MAVVPVVPTITGGILTTSTLAAMAAAATFAQNPPACALRQSAATSLTNAVWTSIGFDISDEDNYNGHSTTVNNSRYTAVYAGYYICKGGVLIASNVTGAREARWAVNGVAHNAGVPVAVLQAVTVATTGTGVVVQPQRLFLNVGDFVELQALQGSGGALNATNSVMSVTWAGSS